MSTTAGDKPDPCDVRCLPTPAVADARRAMAPVQTYRAVAEIFGALADPTRIAIVHALSGREMCTCDLAAVVGVSESGVSQHLRLLRALRLVRARRAGKFVHYSLDDAHVSDVLRLGLEHQGHESAELVETSA